MNRHFNKWTFFKKKKRRNKNLEELLEQLQEKKRNMRRLKKAFDELNQMDNRLVTSLDFREDIMRFDDKDLDNLIEQLLEEE